MSEENKTVELKEEDLKEITGGASGDDISYGSYTVKENGVYINGNKYVFVIAKKPNYGGNILDTLFRYFDGDKFTSGAISHIESISQMSSSYQYECITTEETFRNAKKPSDL